MRFAVTVLGLDLFAVELTTGGSEPDDKARDLSGGTLVSQELATGPVGFGCPPDTPGGDDGA